LWIFAGDPADAYCEASGIPAGVEPWSELIAERNVLAHHLPDEINDERVWFDSSGDISGLREHVDQAAKAIGLAH
jgi:uncharacterized protein with HEPN domain